MTGPVLQQTVRDLGASLVRTVVPVVVGTVLAWLLSRGLDLTQYQNAVNVWLTLACTAGYYAAVRAAEVRWPQVGLLLGWRAQPKYIDFAGQRVPPPVIPPPYVDPGTSVTPRLYVGEHRRPDGVN